MKTRNNKIFNRDKSSSSREIKLGGRLKYNYTKGPIISVKYILDSKLLNDICRSCIFFYLKLGRENGPL